MSFIYNTGFPYLKNTQLTNPAYEDESAIPRTPRYLRADIGFIKDFISKDYPSKKGSKLEKNEKEAVYTMYRQPLFLFLLCNVVFKLCFCIFYKFLYLNRNSILD